MNPDGGIWPSIIIILLTAILGAFLMVGDAAITNLNEGKLKKLLEEKKKHYEQVLRRELDGLDDEFSTLKLLSQELQMRAQNIRFQKAA